jgi:1,4-alpha-glucan branching enzyme
MIVNHGSELKVRQSFPFAQAVYLLGEFNRWSTTATPMFYVGRGVWEASLTVKTGVKQLAYFVWQDGHPFGKVIYQDLDSAPEVEAFLDAASF